MNTKTFFASAASIALALCMTASCNTSFNDGYYVNDNGEPMDQDGGNRFDEIVENPFVKVADAPASTFSVDADGASYAYMRRCVRDGFMPLSNAVRTEEFLNYFTFDYDEPEGGEMLAINAETGACPWNAEHKLLRLGLKGKSLNNNEIPTANYIFLIDVSGSMQGEDRIDLVKTGLCTMLDYMKPEDRVAIITYSGTVKKLLESTLVRDKSSIKNAIKKLVASGCTAGGQAMKMAYEEAVAHYIKGGNNRIIMCTDGDFNVGVSSNDALIEMVESYLSKGIYLSVMGFGIGNLNDSMMENVSNHGNGTYNYIDSEEEMMKVFVNERSRFVAVANDTKCQVTFSPDVVDSYRLIGYENRLMSSEEFENDGKDAGEIGAGQTVTALYEIVPAASYSEDALLATFDVKYKVALGEQSRSLSLGVKVPATDSKSENITFASGVAAYALVLRESEYKGSASFEMAESLVRESLGEDKYDLRKQLLELIGRAAAFDNN